MHYTISYHTALMYNIYVILELELELELEIFSMILIPQDFRTLYHHLISSPTYLHSFLTFLSAIPLISILFLTFLFAILPQIWSCWRYRERLKILLKKNQRNFRHKLRNSKFARVHGLEIFFKFLDEILFLFSLIFYDVLCVE